MPTLQVLRRENLSVFDKVEVNPDHRLNYSDGTLVAAWPQGAETREYRVALFSVREGEVDLPEGSAVLDASGEVVALVPTEAYGGDE